MILVLVLIVSGILFLLIPHFVLPLGYIRGASGAQLLSECSFWYHPETILGIMIILGSIVALRSRKAFIITLIASLFGFMQAYLVRPLSFYIQSEDPIIILSQTYSVRAHTQISATILILSSLVLIVSLIPLIKKKREHIIKLDILHISSSNLKRNRFR